MEKRNDQLRGAIYGLAVGDALGVPVEFMERGTFRVEGMQGYGTHRQPEGTWSDDTSMTLATCDAIRVAGYVDNKKIRSAFEQWAFNGKYTIDGIVFGCGQTTCRAICGKAGISDIRSNGNGSLMRILPLAFTEADAEKIAAVSAITHGHAISVHACQIYVDCARALIAGKDLAATLRNGNEAAPFHRLSQLEALEESEIRSSGYVVDTLEAALWSLLHSHSYAETVLWAVNLGNDTDTVGAVAGGLAGILYGMEAIPAAWLETLRGKDIIEDCLFSSKHICGLEMDETGF